MSEPLAYLITWTCYGTWLPGDKRGWVDANESGIQTPHSGRRIQAQRRMTESPCTLSQAERQIVADTIRRHCAIRGWQLYAVSARTNHVHVVVAANTDPDTVMSELKSWCTRRLKEYQQACGESTIRQNWWTEQGSTHWINNERHLENAIQYVLEGQDRHGS